MVKKAVKFVREQLMRIKPIYNFAFSEELKKQSQFEARIKEEWGRRTKEVLMNRLHAAHIIRDRRRRIREKSKRRLERLNLKEQRQHKGMIVDISTFGTFQDGKGFCQDYPFPRFLAEGHALSDFYLLNKARKNPNLFSQSLEQLFTNGFFVINELGGLEKKARNEKEKNKS